MQQNTTTSSRYTISSASGDTVSVPDYPYFDKGTALFLGFDTGTGGIITGVMDDVYSHTGKPYNMKEVIDFNKKNTYNFEDHYKAGEGLGTLALLSALFTTSQGAHINGTSKYGTEGVFKNGSISVDDIMANPSAFSGKSANEIADVLRDVGYDVSIKTSTRSRSGAQIIQINNSGNGKNITQVQVSSGGGRHGDNPYIKISTSDQGIIKVVDGPSNIYKTDGKETSTIIFIGGK